MLDRLTLMARASERGLYTWHKAAWSLYEPGTPLIDNWHLGAMCDFIQAFLENKGQSNYWVLNVPPGSGKSSVGGISAPTWQWSRDEGACKFLYGSYDIELLHEQSRKCHLVMHDPSYIKAFPRSGMTTTNPPKGFFPLKGGGLRMNASRKGKGTGRHAHVGIVDDPVSAQESFSETAMEEALQWVTKTLPSRGADPNNFRIMLIMQRLSLGDPAEYYLQQSGVEHLMLPMEYVPNAFWDRGNSIGVKDPRKTPGELMFPLRWDDDRVEKLRADLKAEADAQLQQNPVSREGGIVSEKDLRYAWVEIPKRARIIQSWDFSAKGTKTSHSRTAAGLMASGTAQEVFELLDTIQDRQTKRGEPHFRRVPCSNETRYFLLDYRADWMAYRKSKRLFMELAQDPLWRRGSVKLVEEAAAGIALIEDMQGVVSGVRAVKPKDSKEERWRRHSDTIGSELFIMPPEVECREMKQRPSVDDCRLELINFPRGDKDDLVDVVSQGLDFLVSRRARSLANVRKAAEKIGTRQSGVSRWKRLLKR